MHAAWRHALKHTHLWEPSSEAASMVIRLSGRLSTTTTAAAPAFWAFSTFTVNAHGWGTPEASGGPAQGRESG